MTISLPSSDDTLRLLAPSAYVRDRILTRYLPLVTEALQDANEGHRSVEIDVETTETSTSGEPPGVDEHGPATSDPILESGDAAASPASDQSTSERSLLLDEAGLNPRYTFETFVTGPSNQFANVSGDRCGEVEQRRTIKFCLDRNLVAAGQLLLNCFGGLLSDGGKFADDEHVAFKADVSIGQ